MLSRLSSFSGPTSKLFRQRSSALSIVTDNLQLYLNAGNTASYPGSGSAWYDLSANAYSTATLQGNATYSSASGGAMAFDGSGDYVDVNQSLASEVFTIGAWFKSSAAGIKMVISKETAAGNPWNYRIWLNGGQIYADMSQAPANQSSLASPLTNYNNGAWHFVMFSRNDSNWYLYVDGSQVNTKLDPYTGSVTNSQEVWIGRSAYLGGSYDFNGSIGEVMVYHKVLSAAEVLQNYNATRSRYGV